MISLGTTAISALSPWLLAALPISAGLLIYVYRKRGSSTQRVVSSLFLMRNLPRSTPGRRRFIPPLQFWIELLLFALLTCAAATLVINNEGKHIAVVLDTSFSMGAVDRAGASRLERIKSVAQADIAQTLPPARFTVFTAHSSLDTASARGTSTAAAIAAISAVKQELTSDKISLQLESLLSQGTFDSVWIYTDHPLKDGVVPLRTRVVTIPSEPAERVNAWISSLTVRGTQEEPFISATVNSSSLDQLRLTLGATCFDSSSKFELAPLSISVEPKRSATTQLSLKGRKWSYCKVYLALPPGTFDSLVGDNEGWVTNNSERGSINVVSPLSPEELGLSKIKTLSFSKEQTDSSTATIFHRRTPELSTLSAPALIVFPPPGELPLGGTVQPESTSTGLEITRWNVSHPILTYVNPSLIKLPVARRITCPETSTPLLFSQAGALACAGEKNGVRYAVVGFELFPFDGKKTPTLSILTLNLLNWTSKQQGISVLGTSPGVVVIPDNTTAARYSAPSEELLPIAEGRATVYAPHPGILELRSPLGTHLISVNPPSETESALSLVSPIDLPAADGAPRAKHTEEPTDLTPWAALLALAVLLADLLRRLIKKQRWMAA